MAGAAGQLRLLGTPLMRLLQLLNCPSSCPAPSQQLHATLKHFQPASCDACPQTCTHRCAPYYAFARSTLPWRPHPFLLQVGGYQLHMVQGAIGGAKGVGSAAARSSSGGGTAGAAAAAAAGAADPKRKRGGADGGEGGKELTKEEQEFLARREAARQRVQQRTAASFGLS